VLDDELCEQLRRIRYLDLADVIRAAWDDPEAWATGVAERYKVIALDPLSSVASSLDLDFDKSNADYAAFHDRLLKPITDRGVSVLLVDNIGHDPDAKGRAKGASAKQDKADVILSCKRCAQPEGLLVSATKVRSVRAPFARGDRWTFARETLRVERDHGEQQDGRPTVLMERVSRRLEVEPGLTRTKIRDGVQGKHEFVAAALEHLIEGGYVEQRETGPVPVHFVVREFRKEAAVPRSQAVPAPSPNGAEVFGPPVPSFKGRGPGTTLASDCEEAEAIRLLEKHEATT
jgi:hypothetical protein